MPKIGFIGFGNMAQAIASGIIGANIISKNDICAYDVSEAAIAAAAKQGIKAKAGIKELVSTSEYIFLCVKPQNFTALFEAFAGENFANKVLISIAAGVTIKKMQGATGADTAIIRCMPNTPLLLGAGSTAISKNEFVTDAQFNFVKGVFGACGNCYELEESKINACTPVNGSTPAFIYYFAQIVAETAQQNGIDYATALNMFCDTLRGSADMLQKTGNTPQELINFVCSPGGATLAAFDVFYKEDFSGVLRHAFEASIRRTKELSGD